MISHSREKRIPPWRPYLYNRHKSLQHKQKIHLYLDLSDQMTTKKQHSLHSRQLLFVWMARAIGTAGAVSIYALPATEGLSTSAQSLAAVTFLMAVLWMTEAAPVIFTSLLPLVFFPIFEISEFATVLPVYVKDLIWLFLGQLNHFLIFLLSYVYFN